MGCTSSRAVEVKSPALSPEDVHRDVKYSQEPDRLQNGDAEHQAHQPSQLESLSVTLDRFA